MFVEVGRRLCKTKKNTFNRRSGFYEDVRHSLVRLVLSSTYWIPSEKAMSPEGRFSVLYERSSIRSKIPALYSHLIGDAHRHVAEPITVALSYP